MRIKSLWTRCIWNDGRHNAFPGVARFGGHYYVACRHSDGHQNKRASILILRAAADNLDTWEKIEEFDLEGDSRDPFVCVIDNQVCVYWHRQPADWIVRSSDGITWSEPAEIQTEVPKPPKDWDWEFTSKRTWHFRIRKGPDGYYYSLGRCCLASNGNPGILLYRSRDGLSFEACHTFGEGINRDVPKGHESDLAFMEDGSAVADRVADGPGGGHGVIFCAKPPYDIWDGYRTGIINFGGPALHKTSEGLLLAARNLPQGGNAHCCIWEVTPSGLTSPHIVPSGGDCAYQCFANGPDNEVLLCYYSSHEYPWKRLTDHPANLYLARIVLSPAIRPQF